MKNKVRYKKTRLVHVVTELGTGGMENGIINLCNWHDRKKYDLTVCCLKSVGEMAKRLRDDVKVICMNSSEGKPVFQPIKMAMLFKKLRPHIVHTHGIAGGSYVGIIGAKLVKVPVIINGEHGSFVLKPHLVMIQKILACMCYLTLSVSESLKDRVVHNLGIDADKITVIPNGVDTELFSGDYNCSDIHKELLQQHKIIINQNTIVIGCIGSLKFEKNQFMLLKALRDIRLKKAEVDIKVLVIGDGPDKNDLIQFTKDNKLNKNVAFLGNRNDIPRLLSVMNIFASMSIGQHEGMSNVIIEALSSRLPVVATKSVGTNELIKDGENGFLVDPDDLADLVDKIELLSNDLPLQKKLGQNAKSMIKEKFSIDKMVMGYEKVYDSFFSV